MFGVLVDLVIGPAGAIIGAAVASVFVFLAGKRSANYDAEKAYRKSRKELDDVDVGIGASDGDRIKRLHEIASGR